MVETSSNRGIFFSLDAILALGVAFAVIGGIGVYYTLTPELKYRGLHSEAEDLMTVFSTTKVGEIEDIKDKSYVKSGDWNKTLLELVGSLWASGNRTAARNVTRAVLSDLTEKCWELDFSDVTVENSSCEEAETLSIANRIASGYNRTEQKEGYVARGYLTEAVSKLEKSYIFFGGYVGDGNITKNITLSKKDTILNATMELSAGGNFTFSINGNFSGNFTPTQANMSADSWQIPKDYWEYFQSGENSVQFNFTGNKSSISGGFVKVTYNTTGFQYPEAGKNFTKYQFPGIHGVINLYSSFYVPGTLQNISGKIHFDNQANSTIFLRMGNATVMNTNRAGENTVEFNDSDIRENITNSGLSYKFLSNRTVPLRLGTKKFTKVPGANADVILITDVSGSMDWEMNSSDAGVVRDCDSPSLYGSDTQRLSVAKCLDRKFVDKVLNYTGSRVGLVSFETGIDSTQNLTPNKTKLFDEVESYSNPDGGTCICCAENKAYEMLQDQSNTSRDKYVIVMSDGIPTHACDGCDVYQWFWCDRCNSYGTSTSAECNPLGCGGGSADCSGDDCIGPMENANYSASRLHTEVNSTVYSIGFGPVSTCTNANRTLRWIANTGNGTYSYSANATELEGIYSTLASDIVSLSFQAQTVTVEGNVSKNTLYQDSYLLFNHSSSKKSLNYGEVPLTFESDRFGGEVSSPKEGWFWIANGTRVLEARVTSYSSEYWTSLVNISNSIGSGNIFDLSKYGNDYTKLGDPYTAHIPTDKISSGNNTVFIDTALSPTNYTGGSPDSRVIYKLAVEASVGYGSSLSKYQGGNVTVETEAGKTYELSVGNLSDSWDPSKDALDDMVERLLDKLDADKDGKIGIQLSQENLEMRQIKVERVPFLWGPSIFTLKVW